MRFFTAPLTTTFLLLSVIHHVECLQAKATNETQAIAASKIIAKRIISYSKGDGTFYGASFFESAAAWINMLDHYGVTNDTTYNEDISNALATQVGPNLNFRPHGRHDETHVAQALWTFTGLSAVANKINATLAPKLQQAAMNVFDEQTGRWDTTCGGGIPFTINQSGDFYKQTITNVHLFVMAAELARATHNHTMVEWAERIYDWLSSSGLITNDYQVLDGMFEVPWSKTCQIVPLQWSLGYGMLSYGTAAMFNYTKNDIWLERTSHFLDGIKTRFTKNGVIYEPNCETDGQTCADELKVLKGITVAVSRDSENLAPSLLSSTKHYLQTTCQAAMDTCTGGTSGNDCGYNWLDGTYQNDTSLAAELDVSFSISSLYLPAYKH